jgi:hypothetical protein
MTAEKRSFQGAKRLVNDIAESAQKKGEGEKAVALPPSPVVSGGKSSFRFAVADATSVGDLVGAGRHAIPRVEVIEVELQGHAEDERHGRRDDHSDDRVIPDDERRA